MCTSCFESPPHVHQQCARRARDRPSQQTASVWNTARGDGVERGAAGRGGRTHDGANGILIERVPANRHDHRIDGPLPFPFPMPFLCVPVRAGHLPVAIGIPLGCRCGSRSGSESEEMAVLVAVEPREAVVHAAFDVLVAANGEACDRDVGCGDAELRCASALGRQSGGKRSEAEQECDIA